MNLDDLKNVHVGDMVKVVKNIDSPLYDYLIGKRGFITKVHKYTADVQFEYDEEWATPEYLVHYSEIEKED